MESSCSPSTAERPFLYKSESKKYKRSPKCRVWGWNVKTVLVRTWLQFHCVISIHFPHLDHFPESRFFLGGFFASRSFLPVRATRHQAETFFAECVTLPRLLLFVFSVGRLINHEYLMITACFRSDRAASLLENINVVEGKFEWGAPSLGLWYFGRFNLLNLINPLLVVSVAYQLPTSQPLNTLCPHPQSRLMSAVSFLCFGSFIRLKSLIQADEQRVIYENKCQFCPYTWN